MRLSDSGQKSRGRRKGAGRGIFASRIKTVAISPARHRVYAGAKVQGLGSIWSEIGKQGNFKEIWPIFMREKTSTIKQIGYG